jgi:predicted TIM-barrel fold metal-dependent hydrolase
MNPLPIFDAHIHTYGTFLERSRPISEYMNQHNIRKAIITTTNKSANPKAFSNEQSDNDRDTNVFQKAVHRMSNGQLDHSDVDAAAERFPDRFVRFFWFNPKIDSDKKDRDYGVLKQHFDKGYCGVKLHSGIHLVRIPDDVIELIEFMQSCNPHFPLYVHSTPAFSLFQGISGMDFFKLAERFPDLKIIIGHAGFAMEYAIELGFLLKKSENVFFETSCSSPYAILSLLKMAGHRRVLFGSDAPITNPVQVEIDKIMSLPISDGMKEDILYHNTENLLAKIEPVFS